jgi:hypothetical protein
MKPNNIKQATGAGCNHRRGNSQLERLRQVFIANPDRWLSMPYLVEVCGCYVIHSRVADLREIGMNILNNHKRGGGTVSCYKYIPEETRLKRALNQKNASRSERVKMTVAEMEKLEALDPIPTRRASHEELYA